MDHILEQEAQGKRVRSEAQEAPADRPQAARRRLLLAMGALLAARMVVVLVRPGPVILSDEIGYLTNARFLAGGTGADLMDVSFYEAGYSLVLVPVVGLVEDPVAAYRLVLVLNALLAASLVPLLHLLLTRGFRVRPAAAFWPAVAGACYPSVTLSASLAVGENLLYPLYVAWLLCLALLLRARAPAAAVAWSCAAALSAAALWSAHGRMLVAVVLTAVVILGVAWRRPALRPAAVGLGVLALGLLVAHALTTVLVDGNYGGREFSTAVLDPSTIADPQRILLGARNLAGHTWYLLAATLGVVLVFLPDEARRSAARLVRRTAGPRDVLLAVLLLTAIGLLVASALTFGHARRPDRLIYGRYAETVAPPLIAVALSGSAVRRPRLALGRAVAVLLGLSAVVAVVRSHLDVRAAVNTTAVGSFPFRTGDLAPWRLLGGGIVAAASATLLLAVRRRAPDRVPAVVVALFLLVTASALQPVLHRSRLVYPSGWQSIGGAAARLGLTQVAYDVDGDLRQRERDGGLLYPWFLRDAVLVRFSGCGEPPPARYVVSTADWRRRHPARPARAVWKDPARDRTLWELGPAARPQDASARSASALPCRS